MITDTADFRNLHYRQMTDTMDILNIPFTAAVCHAVAATVLGLAEHAPPA